MDKVVPIQESKITISPEERELILSFFKRLKSMTDAMLPADADTVVEMMNKHADDPEMGSLMEYGVVWFFFEPNFRDKATYIQEKSIIYVNIAHATPREYDFDKNEWKDISSTIKKINYSKVVSAFAHEFIHYKQHMIAKQHGQPLLLSKKPYFKQPFEQQAWAVEYLELLRQNLPKLSAADILERLKRLGVVNHPDLINLKKSDYKSWKSIMKNIIVTALQDLKQQEPSKKL